MHVPREETCFDPVDWTFTSAIFISFLIFATRYERPPQTRIVLAVYQHATTASSTTVSILQGG
jgi:hypothetical protein